MVFKQFTGLIFGFNNNNTAKDFDAVIVKRCNIAEPVITAKRKKKVDALSKIETIKASLSSLV